MCVIGQGERERALYNEEQREEKEKGRDEGGVVLSVVAVLQT